MSSSNKGKGVGKGQSNRHKNNQLHNKKRGNNPERSNSTIQTTTTSKTAQSLESNANHMNTKASAHLQEVRKCKSTRTKGDLLTKNCWREDPLMADLLWRSVVPNEERIPRFFSLYLYKTNRAVIIRSKYFIRFKNIFRNYLAE